MANPVFESSPVFGDPRRQANKGAVATQAASTATLEQMYSAPAATARETGRLTYDDVIIKTAGLLGVLVVLAAATWWGTESGALPQGTWMIAMVVGLVLGLVNAFKRKPSPALITLYAAAQGVFLGGISLAFSDLTFDGKAAQPIVLQAVLATMATFGASLWLYSSGNVRVTPKFYRWLIIALVGYLVFQLVNIGLSFFVDSGPFGPMRSGGLGIIVGLIAVGLAAASLIVDFDAIKRGVVQGVPRDFAWTAAFGLVVTLVWLYLEFLRLFAILSGRD